jgi:hypothetical protein
MQQPVTSNLGHKQIRMQHPKWNDLTPLIDVEIVPLIAACWNRDIMTSQCCWNYSERQEAWIEFDSPEDAVKFVSHTIHVARNMVIVTDPKSPHRRPQIWFPHYEIATLTAAINRHCQVPM